MSRDFTPRECLAANNYMSQKNGNEFLDMEFAVYNEKGQKIDYMTPAERIFRKSVPILGTCFDPLWSWHINHNDGIGDDIIESCEAILKKYVNTPDEQRLPATLVPEMWFEGELDPGFYYNTRNDQALLDKMSSMYEAELTRQKVTHEIANDEFILSVQRHGPWTSGCVTEVYPISVWKNDITVYFNTDIDGRKIKGWIKRFISKHPAFILSGSYKHAEGSVPAHITLILSDKCRSVGWGIQEEK